VKTSRWYLYTGAIAFGLVLGGWVATRPPAPAASAPPTPAMVPPAQPAPLPLPHDAPPAMAQAAPASVAPVAPAQGSLAGQVAALAQQGTPQAAYTAYDILARCNWARLTAANAVQHGMKDRSAEVCGDLSPGQLASRTVLLERAAEAGVHGAAVAYMREVWGTTDASTPVDVHAAAAAQRFMHIAAEHGDSDALLVLSGTAQEHHDYAAAMRYLVAFNEAFKQKEGKPYPSYEIAAAQLAKQAGFDLGKVNKLVAEGHAMASNFKEAAK
jgi:hypothetical protein